MDNALQHDQACYGTCAPPPSSNRISRAASLCQQGFDQRSTDNELVRDESGLAASQPELRKAPCGSVWREKCVVANDSEGNVITA